VARLLAVRVISEGRVVENVDIRKPVTVEMEFSNLKEGATLMAAFSFVNELGIHLFVSPDHHEPRWAAAPRPAGVFRTRCTVPGNLFAEGLITVVAEVATREPSYVVHVLEHDCVAFQVVDPGGAGSVRGSWKRNIPGVMRPMLDWHTEFLGPEKKALDQ
jgi:lipopolysaccharide transport system ATP-binding protein